MRKEIEYSPLRNITEKEVLIKGFTKKENQNAKS